MEKEKDPEFCITASEMHNYMGKIPNKTAESAIYRKIAKMYCKDTSWGSYTSASMEWGINTEPLAKTWAEKHTGLIFEKNEKGRKHPVLPISATPDGYCFSEKCTLEIKCPNPDTHIKYVANIDNNETLLKTAPEYYWQMQTQILVYEAEYGLFCTFDPRFDAKMGIKIVRILPDSHAFSEIVDKSIYWTEFAKKIIKNIKNKNNYENIRDQRKH